MFKPHTYTPLTMLSPRSFLVSKMTRVLHTGACTCHISMWCMHVCTQAHVHVAYQCGHARVHTGACTCRISMWCMHVCTQVHVHVAYQCGACTCAHRRMYMSHINVVHARVQFLMHTLLYCLQAGICIKQYCAYKYKYT